MWLTIQCRNYCSCFWFGHFFTSLKGAFHKKATTLWGKLTGFVVSLYKHENKYPKIVTQIKLAKIINLVGWNNEQKVLNYGVTCSVVAFEFEMSVSLLVFPAFSLQVQMGHLGNLESFILKRIVPTQKWTPKLPFSQSYENPQGPLTFFHKIFAHTTTHVSINSNKYW